MAFNDQTLYARGRVRQTGAGTATVNDRAGTATGDGSVVKLARVIGDSTAAGTVENFDGSEVFADVGPGHVDIGIQSEQGARLVLSAGNATLVFYSAAVGNVA